jgi:hypothetical protein
VLLMPDLDLARTSRALVDTLLQGLLARPQKGA